MRMVRLVGILGLVGVLAACTKVPAGNVGVKFDLYGSSKGVTGEVVGPGKYWLGMNEEMYLFPTFSQNVTWVRVQGGDESITFQDKEGTQINADVGISFAIDPAKADAIFQKYRKGIDEIADIYVRNMVRDALNAETSKMGVEDIFGLKKEDLMIAVTKRVKDQIAGIGINVEKIYWVGPMRLPESITAAINAKIAATQKAQQRENELQTAKAQAEIDREKARGEADAVIIAAEAQAKANRLMADSVTPNLIQYHNVQRWDGKLPTMMTGAVPMVNIQR